MTVKALYLVWERCTSVVHPLRIFVLLLFAFAVVFIRNYESVLLMLCSVVMAIRFRCHLLPFLSVSVLGTQRYRPLQQRTVLIMFKSLYLSHGVPSLPQSVPCRRPQVLRAGLDDALSEVARVAQRVWTSDQV
jgi:hypothetical protein